MANNANFRVKNGIDIRVETGNSPIVTSSTVLVSNLNADLLDGQEGSYYLNLSNATGVLSLANGGTGQATANDSLNALLPSQTGNNGKVLSTNGSNTSWVTVAAVSAVTSVDTTAPAAGLTITGGPITSTGTFVFGLANDLAALEGLSGTGFAVRTGVDSWTLDTNTYAVSGHTHTIANITNLQTTLDGTVVKAGSTMNSAANLTFSGGGEVIGLPATPTSATAAASKAYVDSVVTSGATWKSPLVDPNLINAVAAIPGSPTTNGTYIKWNGTQNETWGAVTNVVNNDILSYDGAGWTRISTLAAGNRFIIAGVSGTVGAALSSAGFVNDDIIQYVSGDPTSAGSWTLPDGRGDGGTPGSELAQGTTILVNLSTSYFFGRTYLYDATGNVWVEIAGPGSISAGVGLAYSGNVLNINLGAGIVELPADNVGIDYHASGGLFTTVDGTSASTASNAQIAVKLNGTTLSLSASGLALTSGVATPNTYKSVTVDTYGRVTGGTNPTTLSGYGITDAVSNTVVSMSHGVLSSTTNTLTTVTPTSVMSLSAASYRVVEYLVQVTEGTAYQGAKLLVVHDGSTAYITEYGQVFTGATLGTFDADINGGNIRLMFTSASTNSTTIKVVAMSVAI
ncbi:MAG: beta strand repeat-containing protein [Nitrososphaeraceae archaeon]